MWATNAAARTSPVASTGQVRDGGQPGASVSAVHTSPTAPSTRSAPAPSTRQPPAGPLAAALIAAWVLTAWPRQDGRACHQRGQDDGQVDEEDPAPARLHQQ